MLFVFVKSEGQIFSPMLYSMFARPYLCIAKLCTRALRNSVVERRRTIPKALRLFLFFQDHFLTVAVLHNSQNFYVFIEMKTVFIGTTLQ